MRAGGSGRTDVVGDTRDAIFARPLSQCSRTNTLRCEYQSISMGHEHHGLCFAVCPQTHDSRPLANRSFVCVVAKLLVAVAHIVVRFSAGWYIARFSALVASFTLLIVLLTESTALYARLANAFVLLRRERADRLANVQAATAAMAHELRQPLTGIATRGSAGMNWLKRTPPELEKARECFQSVIDASLRANEVIAAIRELYRKRPTEHTMVQINDVVHEVLALVQDDFRTEAVIATAEYQENLPQIHASHTQIQQVILNLVKNAVEAMRSVPPDKR